MAWVESPSYVLRRWTVLRELRSMPRGRLLEVGCGAGDLLVHLAADGFDASCVETSTEARAEASRRFRQEGLRINPAALLEDIEGRFDVVIACEVLEHIRDDESALRHWRSLLVPGGRLLITVPAHTTRFGPSDTWAGHFRRYGRADLERLAESAGLQIERLLCYAFPLGNLIEPVRNAVNRRRLGREGGRTAAHRTARSGTERTIERRLSWLSGRRLLAPFCWLQIPFFRTALGTGYLVLARRPEGAEPPGNR